jgi:hypothetical protein
MEPVAAAGQLGAGTSAAAAEAAASREGARGFAATGSARLGLPAGGSHTNRSSRRQPDGHANKHPFEGVVMGNRGAEERP